MRPHGKVFYGSNSMFDTQGIFRTYIGRTIWFSQFTSVKQDHLVFVQALLHTLCSLGICCALTGTYPAYIAGMVGSHYIEERFLHKPSIHSEIAECLNLSHDKGITYHDVFVTSRHKQEHIPYTWLRVLSLFYNRLHGPNVCNIAICITRLFYMMYNGTCILPQTWCASHGCIP